MDTRDLPVALFDSGMGGLTVLKAVRALLPAENLVYLGDTARLPYGTKGRDTIVRYTLKASEKAVERGAKLLVIACNTATAAALPVLRQKYDIPVLGVIGPGARAAVAATRNGRIAVLATEATIRDGAYQRAIKRIAPNASVLSRACTLLVPLAEEGWYEGNVARDVLERYLDGLFEAGGPDTLLLGCTHFPLFKKQLRRMLPETAIVDSAEVTAREVAQKLKESGIARSGVGTCRYLTTDNPERFAALGALFLGAPLDQAVELVDL